MIVAQVIGMVFLALLVLLFIYLAIVIFSPWIKEPRQPLSDVPSPESREAARTEMARRDLSEIPRSVRFHVDDETLVGDLYLPVERTEPLPCIILNHGLGGTKEMVVEAFALRFCEAGFAALTFDYRHFGASDGEPRHHISLKKQVEDCRAAIAFVRGREEIDAGRIAIWGTSAGGGYGFVIAAQDSSIACVSAQCPGLDHGADGKLVFKREGLGWMLKLIMHAQRDKGRSRFGLSPHRIPIVGRPGTTALLTAPGALEGYADIAGPDFPNEVCGRVMMTPHGKMPDQIIEQVKCPALFQICEKDELVSVAGSIRVAERMGDLAEIKLYPIGHFDIYRGEAFERAVNDQIDFFTRHLAA